MKITFTIDSILREKLDGITGKPEFWDTYRLIKAFAEKGHEVSVVQTEDAIKNGFSKEIYLEGNKEFTKDFEIPDVFFTRSYGLRVGRDCFENFVNTTQNIQNKVPMMINSGNANSFSKKKKQKNLPLPFIPYYRINKISEIEDLLNENKEGLILKPDYGLQSNGVEYFNSINDLEKIAKRNNLNEDELIKNNSYEKFIADKKETRYIYLFGEMIGSRIAEKEGEPGKEILGKRYLNKNPKKEHLDIAKKAIELTGIDFGCVDFRGKHILEINGSGTQTFYRSKVGGGKEFLDIIPNLLNKIEEKYKKL